MRYMSEIQAHHRLRAGGGLGWCRGEEEGAVKVAEEEEIEVKVKGRPAPPRGSFPAEVRFQL